MLKLKLSSSIQLEKVKMLLKKTEELHLDELKEVKNILYELDGQGFPYLKHFLVQNCSEIQYIIDSVTMGPYVAFPHLETMFLDYLMDLEKLCRGALGRESFSSLRNLTVRNCNKLKNLFSHSVARGLAQLMEINVSSCQIIEGIVAKEPGEEDSNDEPKMLSRLCSLTLENLPRFVSFSYQSELASTSGAGLGEIIPDDECENHAPLFNGEVTFPNLTDLKLISIGLERIWSNKVRELSPCFQKITTLKVDDCANLTHLFTPYVVQSLGELKRLEIHKCNSMEQVIGAHEDTKSKFVFPKLEFLKLKGLPNLMSFCTGESIECPSLITLWIESCPQLETFICEILSLEAAFDDEYFFSRFNNEFVQENCSFFYRQVKFPMLEELTVMGMPKLKMIWDSEMLVVPFPKLKLLQVHYNCKLRKIFPPKVLEGFQNLESLSVKNCDLLEEVFDLKGLIKKGKHVITITSQLRTLNIALLPSLKYVWNEDPQGIFLFHNLSSVTINGCPCLSSIFPASIAAKLPRLQFLQVLSCGLEEIISKGEGSEESPKFVFHQLMNLRLLGLKKLKCFYNGTHTWEFPMLKQLNLFHCKYLFSILESNQDQQLVLSLRKVYSNLEELSLSGKDLTVLKQGQQYPADFFHKVKVLNLQCLDGPSSSFRFDLLQKFPNLEKLCVSCSSAEVPFPCRYGAASSKEEHVDGVTHPHIQHLVLNGLLGVTHLWNQESQIDQILQNLDTLVILSCFELTTLAPSFASFRNLKTLTVRLCRRLVNIMASSAAKKMVNLSTLVVQECDMVTEIISDDGDDLESEEEIVFKKLRVIRLCGLKKLSNFCSANCSIRFPRLEILEVTGCYNMSLFSHGVFSAPMLHRVYVTPEREKWHWLKDLNTTILNLYQEKERHRERDDYDNDLHVDIATDWYRKIEHFDMDKLRNSLFSAHPQQLCCSREDEVVVYIKSDDK